MAVFDVTHDDVALILMDSKNVFGDTCDEVLERALRLCEFLGAEDVSEQLEGDV